MIVYDFNVFGISASPPEADSPLVVNADAVLSFACSTQRLEAISRRHFKELEFDGGIDQLKLRECPLLDIRGQTT
nr:hypothetical protein [Opitutus sp. ER46]